jgi:hypothetical protein
MRKPNTLVGKQFGAGTPSQDGPAGAELVFTRGRLGLATLHGHPDQGADPDAGEERGEGVAAHTATHRVPGFFSSMRHRGGRMLRPFAGTLPGLFGG